MGKRKYTDKQFVDAVKTSFTMAETLRKINLSATGANYKLAKLRIKNLGIDNSHFTGQSHLKGKTHNWTKSIPLEEILVKDSNYLWNQSLKRRLFKEGLFENKCYNCGLTKWLGKSISCQLEHKNGDNTDNSKENLTILCPNCHSQTKTFAGRNKKDKEEKHYYCKKCGVEITRKSKSGLCVKCVKQIIPMNINNRKVKNRPSKAQLLLGIKELGYAGMGRKYGVSDNCIRKWLK